MTLRITDNAITSDECSEIALREEDGSWTVTGRPGRYDRNQAISAMSIAEVHAQNPPVGDPAWAHVIDWESEL